MSDISIPHNLAQADAVLNLSTLLQKLLDPSERKSLADDISKFHALNDTEAKRASEARSLIKDNQAILDEAKKVSASNEKDRKNIKDEREKFDLEKIAERKNLDQESQELEFLRSSIHTVHEETVVMKNDIISREQKLTQDKADHEVEVRKHLEDKKNLDAQRREMEIQRNQILELDKQTKEKVEALKKFNF